jgi:hypothetical protein
MRGVQVRLAACVLLRCDWHIAAALWQHPT